MLTEDYQFELPDVGFIFGCGTPYPVRRPDPKGFIGSPPVKMFDQDVVQVDGAVPGIENYGTRILTIPIRVYDKDPAVARSRYQDVLDAWQLRRTGEVALDARIPGTPETVIRYYGRPREITETQSFVAAGLFEADLVFDATDPYGYGAEVTVSSGTSPLSFTNAGKVSSSRALITYASTGILGGNIINTSDPNAGNISVRDDNDLSVNSYEFDLRRLTLTGPFLSRLESKLKVDSKWFPLQPGANVLTFVGASNLSITYRPAWL